VGRFALLLLMVIARVRAVCFLGHSRLGAAEAEAGAKVPQGHAVMTAAICQIKQHLQLPGHPLCSRLRPHGGGAAVAVAFALIGADPGVQARQRQSERRP
jgi:hypothetical protein